MKILQMIQTNYLLPTYRKGNDIMAHTLHTMSHINLFKNLWSVSHYIDIVTHAVMYILSIEVSIYFKSSLYKYYTSFYNCCEVEMLMCG